MPSGLILSSLLPLLPGRESCRAAQIAMREQTAEVFGFLGLSLTSTMCEQGRLLPRAILADEPTDVVILNRKSSWKDGVLT